MEKIEKIESQEVEVQGENIIILPPDPTTVAKDDYLTQIKSRIEELTQSKVTTEAQLESINQALSDAEKKLIEIEE